jgi:hypothetical protein
VRTSSLRLADANDTRLLLAGVAAVLTLVAYLAVAFADTHAFVAASLTGPTNPTKPTNKFAPFVPSNSHMALVPSGTGGLAIRVTPAAKVDYGALAPTLVSQPTPGLTYVFGLWLRGAHSGRVGIEIDEFRAGPGSPKLVDTTVPMTPRWRHFTFTRRVRGRWLGLGMFVFRPATRPSRRKWFDLRDVSVQTRRR